MDVSGGVTEDGRTCFTLNIAENPLTLLVVLSV